MINRKYTLILAWVIITLKALALVNKLLQYLTRDNVLKKKQKF